MAAVAEKEATSLDCKELTKLEGFTVVDVCANRRVFNSFVAEFKEECQVGLHKFQVRMPFL